MSQANQANEAKQLRELVVSLNSKLDHMSSDLDHLSGNLDTLESSQQEIKLSSDGTSSGVATMIARIGDGTGGHKSVVLGNNGGSKVELKCDTNGVLSVAFATTAKTNSTQTLNLAGNTYTTSSSTEITGDSVGMSFKSITYQPRAIVLQASHNNSDWVLHDSTDIISMTADPSNPSHYSFSNTIEWKPKYIRFLFDNGGAVAFDIDIVIHQ